MSDENNPSLFTTIKNLFAGYAEYTSGVFRLAKLETKLALNSAFLMVILFFVLLILVSSAWLSLLVLSFFVLVSFHLSAINAAGIIFLANVVLIAATLFTLSQLKKNLYFTATRKHIVAPLQTEVGVHEQIETAN